MLVDVCPGVGDHWLERYPRHNIMDILYPLLRKDISCHDYIVRISSEGENCVIRVCVIICHNSCVLTST